MVDQQCNDEGLRELALFAGAGGGILGGQLLGWRTVCAVERDAQLTFWPRMLASHRLARYKLILNVVDIKHYGFPLERQTWVLTILGEGGGYLHTPTTKANWSAKSMQKHKCCQNSVQVFGKPTPENQEWMMGWPIGWTDLEPLETDKFQLWLQQHGKF